MRQLDAIGCKAPPSPGGILESGLFFFLHLFFLALFFEGVVDVVDSAEDCEVNCEHMESVSAHDSALMLVSPSDCDAVSRAISRPSGAK